MKRGKSHMKISRETLRGLMIDKLYEFVVLGLHDPRNLSAAEVAILPQIAGLLFKYDLVTAPTRKAVFGSGWGNTPWGQAAKEVKDADIDI